MVQLTHWINPEYLDKRKTLLLKKQFVTNKPFSHLALKNFFLKEKAAALRKALLSLKYERKNSDLFSFLQSEDLKAVKNKVIQEFAAFYSSEELKRYISTITAEQEIKGIDLSGFIYEDTDYLLPHDDRLQSRKIAYVINFSKKFTEQDGGQLKFFSITKKGKEIAPVEIVKKFIPTFNTLYLFKVCKESFHQVSEVTSVKKRITIAGWFHGKEMR